MPTAHPCFYWDFWGFYWSERRDLNPRPFAPEANALPDCATLRRRDFHEVKVADSIRFPRRKVNGETSAAEVEVYDGKAGKEAGAVYVDEPELETFMMLREIDGTKLQPRGGLGGDIDSAHLGT